MTQVTTHGITKWTNDDPASMVQMSQAMGDSVDAALGKRERFDFTWVNSSERTAQTGMVQGSRGYQIDTKTEYLYDNSQWRLGLPYAEFSFAVKTIPNAVYTALGQATIDNAASTSTTFVTAPAGDGRFLIVDPGVYGFSIYAEQPGGAPIDGQSHVVVSSSPAGVGVQYTRGYFTGGQSAMVPMPFMYLTSANTTLYVSCFQNIGASTTIEARLRIGRFG
jgi:hypothetical protein